MDQSFRTATSRPSWCSCVERTPSSFLHHPTTNFPPFTRLTLLPKGQRLQLSTDSRPIWVLTAGSRYMNGIIFLNSQPLKHHEDQIQKTTTSLFHLKCHILLLHKICTKSPVLILCLSTQSQHSRLAWSCSQTKSSHQLAPQAPAQEHKLVCGEFFICLHKTEKLRATEWKFHKVKFINAEDFSLFGHSVPLPYFGIKIKSIDIKMYIKTFIKWWVIPTQRFQELHFGKTEVQIRSYSNGLLGN